MSTDHDNNTRTWCNFHADTRVNCGCRHHTGADGEALEDRFSLDVATELHKYAVREAAQAQFARARQPAAPPFDDGLLRDILRRPPEPPYRVGNLIPSDAGTLLVAQRKTGKTTLVLNLALSLTTGMDFLGSSPVLPIQGSVGFLNYEVSAAQLARWAADVDIPGDRLYLVNLRGRRNPLDDPDDRAELVRRLKAHQVETLIVDPFGRAFTGASQNDSGEVGAWLTRLDTFARGDVGARDLILTAHAGWNGERTRGSSALEDWADSIITLTRGDDDDGRYLRATGRDVDMEEDRLHFDPATRALTLTGLGSRQSATSDRAIAAAQEVILAYVGSNPGASGADIEKSAGKNKGAVKEARDRLVKLGALVAEPRRGRGGGYAYRLPVPAIEPPPTSPNIPRGHV